MTMPWDYVDEGKPGTGVPNLPTPEGRALGVEMARLVENERERFEVNFPREPPMCDECAFRAGTVPNGCPGTLMNALKCVMEDGVFYCHKGVQGGDPKRLCTGFCIARLGVEVGRTEGPR